MADVMRYPECFEDFIKEYEFKDEQEIYTNGSELIPSFRVMQAWEHYTNHINQSLSNIYECISMITRNLEDIEDAVE